MTPLFTIKCKRVDAERKLISHDPTQNDAGYDIFTGNEDVVLNPGVNIIGSGLALQLDFKGFDKEGFMQEKHNYRNPQVVSVVEAMLNYMLQNQFRPWIQVRDKSSRASQGLIISAGIVDEQFTGEITVVITNTGTEPITIEANSKITQVIPMLTPIADYTEVPELTKTKRGEGKLGSTGLK